MLMVVIKLLYLYFLDSLEATTYHSSLPELSADLVDQKKEWSKMADRW